eukprot:4564207-Amphidinium_carterae.1
MRLRLFPEDMHKKTEHRLPMPSTFAKKYQKNVPKCALARCMRRFVLGCGVDVANLDLLLFPCVKSSGGAQAARASSSCLMPRFISTQVYDGQAQDNSSTRVCN